MPLSESRDRPDSARRSMHDESPDWVEPEGSRSVVSEDLATLLEIAGYQIPYRSKVCQSSFSSAVFENGQFPAGELTPIERRSAESRRFAIGLLHNGFCRRLCEKFLELGAEELTWGSCPV